MKLSKYVSAYRGLPRDVYVLFAARVVNQAGSFVMPLMTLILTQKIGLEKGGAGFFVTLSMAAQAPFLLLGGKLADRFGSKRVIVVMSALGASVFLLCAFLRPGISVAWLIILAAALYAAASPAFGAIVVKVAPPEQLKSSYSMLYLGVNLGLAVGPLLGGLLFQSHLRLLFLLDAVTTLLSAALILLAVREGAGAASSPEASGEKAKDSAPVLRFLLQNPALLVFAAVMLIYTFCYIQWNFMLPLQLAETFKAGGARLFSLLYSLNAFSVIVFTPLLTQATRRMHPLQAVFAGGVLYFCAFAVFAAAGGAPAFAAAIVVMTLGEILISINENAFIAERTPVSHMARTHAVLNIVEGVGFAVGPVAMGNLLPGTGYRTAWLLVAGLELAASLMMLALRRRGAAPAAEIAANPVKKESI